ncbi:unnamed protein product [Lathyrus oleraceus]
MVKIVQFVIVVIIFLSFFLVLTKVEALGKYCFWDSDCPEDMCRHPSKAKCIYHFYCKCITLKFIEPT